MTRILANPPRCHALLQRVSLLVSALLLTTSIGFTQPAGEEASSKAEPTLPKGCKAGYIASGIYQIGRFIMLDDKSNWQVQDPYTAKSFYWQRGDRVAVCGDKQLYNINADDLIDAKRIK